MNAIHRRRLIVLASIGLGISLTTALTLYALSHNINVFYTPSQIKTQALGTNKICRIGGMVMKDSVLRKEDLSIEFIVSDFQEQVKIHYRGILPDLFKEGQGIVALGKMQANGEFTATQVLAKHDEKYMPPEMAMMVSAANLTKQK